MGFCFGFLSGWHLCPWPSYKRLSDPLRLLAWGISVLQLARSADRVQPLTQSNKAQAAQIPMRSRAILSRLQRVLLCAYPDITRLSSRNIRAISWPLTCIAFPLLPLCALIKTLYTPGRWRSSTTSEHPGEKERPAEKELPAASPPIATTKHNRVFFFRFKPGPFLHVLSMWNSRNSRLPDSRRKLCNYCESV